METKTKYSLILVLFLAMMNGCFNPVVVERDPSAGFNGGFEKTKHGLPVNWYFYTSEEYEKSYKIILDIEIAKEGKQSLRFEVLSIDTLKIHEEKLAPGMFGLTDAEIGEKYKVSFWIKNQGCEFNINVGNQFFMFFSEVILETDENFTDWTYFEYEYTIPESNPGICYGLYFLSPGTFWIDDVRLVKLSE
jgi:hypothetical protein